MCSRDGCYIYPSHDIDGGVPADDLGSHYAMEDYHVFRQDTPASEAVDCGLALHVKDVPWAAKQMWAPDAACKDGRYYLYFPAKRADGIFQIGVAVGDRPEGPFKAEPRAIEGSYSIDPAVLADDGGTSTWCSAACGAGSCRSTATTATRESNVEPADHEPALGPRIARLSADMKQFAGSPARDPDPRRARRAAARRRPCAALFRRPVDAQVPRPVLPVVLHRQHAPALPCHR